VEVSDNGAANVVLAALGGPHALTRRFAQWGDRVTRLDRTEPTLNENASGDRRDTTSPVAMATLIGRMARNQILAPADSETLRQWSRASETGLRRIRAGLPQGMIAGDKTGTCGQPHEAVNDVAWFHAAGEAPGSSWSLAVYLDRPTVDTARANAILGEIGRIADLRIRDAAAR
jgi:beta-lactamase class A